MKRRSFVTAGGVGLATAAIAAPAIAQSQPELKWRLAASWPKSLDTFYGGAEYLAKRVAEATDNKFQIRVFAGGEIVPALQVLDAVQNNTVEMGHTASYYYVGKDPTFGFDCTIPFGMNCAADECLDDAWRRAGAAAQLLQGLQRLQHPGGQYRGADGRLVPQGDQDRRRSEGPQVPHRQRLGAARS